MKFYLLLIFSLLSFKAISQNNSDFYLSNNGKTCMCPDAEIGDTGTLTINNQEITFTKRSVDQITPENADTSCISGVTNLNRLFENQTDFNKDISHWDTSNVTSMAKLFKGCENFNQDLNDWDVSNVTNMFEAFYATFKFNQDLNNWDVSNVTEMERMFMLSLTFDGDISNWNVSNVTDMAEMFLGAEKFNQDIGSWDVSKVTDMTRMFAWYGLWNGESFTTWGLTDPACDNCGGLFNQDLSNWDVSSNTSFKSMFFGQRYFNSPLNTWDVSNAFYNESTLRGGIVQMFDNAISFNQPLDQWDLTNKRFLLGIFNYAISFDQDLNGWNVSSVEYFDGLFSFAEKFNGDVTNWDTANAKSMYWMFINCNEFNQDIGDWNVSNVRDMSRMFATNYKFNQDISNWDVSKVESMQDLFMSASVFNQDISNWDVSSVRDMSGMFAAANSFQGDITNWNTSSAEDMDEMFYNNQIFNQDIGNWNVSNVKRMKTMFFGAKAFNQDISGWNVSNVTDMSLMFNYASAFNQNLDTWELTSLTTAKSPFYKASKFNGKIPAKFIEVASDLNGYFLGTEFNQDISNWDVSHITSMIGTFRENDFFNQNISSWDVSNVTNMSGMFFDNEAFDSPLNSWDVSSVTDMSQMFHTARGFNQSLSDWDVSNVTNMERMFLEADTFNQNISSWDVSKVTNMSRMFDSADNFNQSIGQWNVSSVSNFRQLFRNASNFNQELSNWNLSSNTDSYQIVKGSYISLSNSDKTIKKWWENGYNNVYWDLDYIESNIIDETQLSTRNWVLNGNQIGYITIIDEAAEHYLRLKHFNVDSPDNPFVFDEEIDGKVLLYNLEKLEEIRIYTNPNARRERGEYPSDSFTDFSWVKYCINLKSFELANNWIPAYQESLENRNHPQAGGMTYKDTIIDFSNMPTLEVLTMGGFRNVTEVNIEGTNNLKKFAVEWVNKLNTSKLNSSLRNLPNLEFLSTYGDSITQIDITQNPNLKDVYLIGNKLTELNTSNNPNIIKLDARQNYLNEDNVDFSQNSMIESLNLSYNNFGNVKFLENNQEITYLNLAFNLIEEVDLTKLPNLDLLLLDYNLLEGTLDLSANTLLTRASVSGGKLYPHKTYLDQCYEVNNCITSNFDKLLSSIILPESTTLHNLNLMSQLNLEQIDLSTVPNLEYLNLSGITPNYIENVKLYGKLKDLVGIESLRNLKELQIQNQLFLTEQLNLSETSLTYFDGSQSYNLKSPFFPSTIQTIQCQNCNFTGIENLSNLQSLVGVSLDNNPYDQNGLIEEVKGNNFETVDFSNLASLSYLNLVLSGVRNIKVDNTPSLSTLMLQYNKINDIDLSKASGLTSISLNNQETSRGKALQYVNLKNGNNSSINYLNTRQDGKPQLIDVDSIELAESKIASGQWRIEDNALNYTLAKEDSDEDGIQNYLDNCSEVYNPNQEDLDQDGQGDICDPDDDGDEVPDTEDAFPLDATESVDSDGDGVGNNADTDDDEDGVLDTEDAFPLDATESVDTDSDGIGNNVDTDDDGDDWSDEDETAEGTDPLDAQSVPVDTDNDGIGNVTDTDDDGDEVPDTEDAFPLDATESVDTDSDGIGNNADTDDDGDEVPDSEDAFPLDATEAYDADGDGVGDNADDDDDNDQVKDVNDECPNSELGVTVDAKGCEVFALPSNTFSVSVTSATCPDSSNGSITISSSNTDYSYRYAIDDQAPQALTDNTQTISNLSAGIYTVCVTVDGVSDYQRCYTIEITEPAPLVASSRIDISSRNMELDLSGSEEYQVTLNGKTFLTSKERLSLNLEPGMNRVEVATALDCQGEYFEEIFVSEEVKVYPNPTPGPLQLFVAGSDSEVEMRITSLSGNIIKRETLAVPMNRIIETSLGNLPEGLYLITLNGTTVKTTHKVIKE